MGDSLKNKAFRGIIWNAIESFSGQGIQFIIMIIMARLLSPSDYGIIGMLAIFLAISNTFINSGFASALMRKSDRTEVDKSTVFLFNIISSLFFYSLLFICAPLISSFYNMPILTPVTRVIGISLILGALTSVQRMQFALKLNFKILAKISICSTLVSGIIGIALAWSGFGVWALVAQQIVALSISSLLQWSFSSWKPTLIFSRSSFKELFSFGSKLLASDLINTVYGNIYSIVIGKIYSASDLGFYSRGRGFSSFFSNSLTGILQRVTFPLLCNLQNNEYKLYQGYRTLIRISTFVIFPLMIGMAAVSEPMVTALIGEKWSFTGVLLVPICLASMWYPMHSLNLNLLQVKGRSDLFLRLEIIKKIFGIVVLIGTVPLGLYWMCWGSLLSSLIALVINTYYTGKLINFGFFKQIKDIASVLILSLVMGVAVWTTLKILILPPVLKLTIGIIEGAFIYIGGAKLFHFTEFNEILSLLKRNNKNEQPDNSNLTLTAES